MGDASGAGDAVSLSSLRTTARSVYGTDVAEYDAGRPDYPPEVYEALRSRCGLRPGAAVLEVGPGNGLVTRRLLEAGARVTAVEPDAAMARHLASAVPQATIVPGTFEEVALATDRFDLAVSATAFHWVDQRVGIPKLAGAIRPGGWAALWWNIFDDPDAVDPFRDQLEARFGEPDPGGQRKARFQRDIDGRCADLVRLGGFVDVTATEVHWVVDMSSTQLRALYGSMMAVRRRSHGERERLLDAVGDVADEEGATVRRPFVTFLYTALRPEGG